MSHPDETQQAEDARLLAGVEQRGANAWEKQDLVRLAERVVESPEFRRQLLRPAGEESPERVEYLRAAFLEIGISLDALLASAAKQDQARLRSRWLALAVCVGLILVFVIGSLRMAGRRELPPTSEKSPAEESAEIVPQVNPLEEAPVEPVPLTAEPPEAPPEQTVDTAAEKPALEPPDAATPEPAPMEPPPVVLKPGPWNFHRPAVSFAATAYSDLASDETIHDLDQLREWFLPVENESHAWLYQQRSSGSYYGVEGLVRLATAWPEDAVWRLGFFDAEPLRLTFWNGSRGVLLVYQASPQPFWAAYAVERSASEPIAPAGRMLTSDDGRSARLPPGLVSIRWQQGMLRLTSGETPLIAVPLERPPGEVYLQGKCWLRGLAMFRGEPAPEGTDADLPTLLGDEPPAALPWQPALATGGEWITTEAGHARLAAPQAEGRSQALLPAPERTLYDIVLRIEEATPGTGIVLTGADQTPVAQLAVVRHAANGWAVWDWTEAGEDLDAARSLQSARAPAYAGPGQWLRLLYGAGTVKCWISADGQHWGRALVPQEHAEVAVHQVGLFAAAGIDRQIEVSQWRFRQLDALAALLPESLAEQIQAAGLPPAVNEDFSLANWLLAVLAARPAEIDPASWRIGCALATLRQSPPHSASLNGKLIGAMALELADSTAPLAVRRRQLDQLALVADTWRQADAQEAFAEAYLRLGRRQMPDHAAGVGAEPAGGDADKQAELPLGFTNSLRAQLRSPGWEYAGRPTPNLALFRQELLLSVAERRWTDAQRLAQTVRQWYRPDRPGAEWSRTFTHEEELIEWAESAVRRQVVGGEGEGDVGDVGGGVPSWRHPLAVEVGREAYNVLAGVDAAIDAESYEDAVQVISVAGSTGEIGLLPSAHDPQLYLPLAGRLAAYMRDEPQLRQTMIDRLGPRGMIRVRAAIAAGDVPAVEAATIQFFGTDAAVEAHLALGDRSLEIGDFVAALGEYQQALEQAGPLIRGRVAARVRLAAAFHGREAGVAVTQPVTLGEQQFSPAEFEQLVANLRRRAASQEPGDNLAEETACHPDGPAPAALKLVRWDRLVGESGSRSGREASWMREEDWVGRQLATAVTDDLLLISNRFQTTAWDLETGKRRWQTDLGSDPGGLYDWSMIAMRPVVAGQRVFVRRLHAVGPRLACLALADGAVIWETRDTPFDILADPIPTPRGLVTLIQQPEHARFANQVRLAAIDPETGRITPGSPLAEIREDRSSAAITISGDYLLASLPGALLAATLEGELRWIREEQWLPRTRETFWGPVVHRAPLVVGGQVYAVQPAARNVSCVELATGRLRWRQVLPDLEQLVYGDEEVVVVAGGNRLLGIDARSGEVRWSNPTDSLSAVTDAGSAGIVYVDRIGLTHLEWVSRLVWLDPVTGRQRGQHTLDGLNERHQGIHPLIAGQGRLWLTTSQGEPERDVLELVPDGPAKPGHEVPELGPWAILRKPDSERRLDAVLPGWAAVSGSRHTRTGWHDQMYGEKNLFGTAADENPALFTRRVSIPAEGKTKLAMRLAQGSDKTGTRITIAAAGQTLRQESFASTGAADAWREFTIDLTPLAGQTVDLTVLHEHATRGLSVVYWQRLDIVTEP